MKVAEMWLAIRGYEGLYEVSDLGRVRSLDRVVSSVHGSGTVYAKPVRGRLLLTRPLVKRGGHYVVGLHREGRFKNAYVHQLVLSAFVGPRPPGHITRHLNGDPSDNRLVNLAWGTHSENGQDMLRHGTHRLKNRTHCNHGHPFSGTNLYINPKTGYRRCRACSAASARRYQKRLKGSSK